MTEGQVTKPLRDKILNCMRQSGLILDGRGNIDTEGGPRPDQPLFLKNATKPSAACNDGCYGLDSLDRVELAMSIEDHFDVEISDAEVNDLNTLEDIESYLAGRGCA